MRYQRKTRQEFSNGNRGDRVEQSRRPVYHISVVAQMVETHPQTLRMYERMGLVAPCRTGNNIRLYSEADVDQVRRIQHLTQDLGVNLAGVEVVFKLLKEMERLRSAMADLPAENAGETSGGPSVIAVDGRHAARPTGSAQASGRSFKIPITDKPA